MVCHSYISDHITKGDRCHILGIKIYDRQYPYPKDTNVIFSIISPQLEISAIFQTPAIDEGTGDIFALPPFIHRDKSANIRQMEARRRQRRADVTGVEMRSEVEKRANEVQALQEERETQEQGSLPPLDFIMQPLKVGVTPIGRKYELRLSEIAWRTLLYLYTILQQTIIYFTARRRESNE